MRSPLFVLLTSSRTKRIRKFWWAATASYLGVIYTTLGVAPLFWNRINTLLGGRGLIAQYILYAAIAGSILIYITLIKKDPAFTGYFLFFIFVGIMALLIRLEKNPGEKIHPAEYGILGILVYNALKTYFSRWGNGLYLYGSLICLAAGAVDEVIQGVLPNRYFTWHDVLVNGASGVIVLLVIRFNILKKERIDFQNTVL